MALIQPLIPSMIIDNPKIAIDPYSEDDKVTFEQKGYRVIKQEEFSIELKSSILGK